MKIAAGTTLHYRVGVQIDGRERNHRVQIIDGYSTFGDIPKIVAIVEGVPVERVKVVFVGLDSETDGPQ